MLRTPQAVRLVPALAVAALLIALPASARGHERQAPCAAPRIPPGTYTIQVHDLSTSHDFHLAGAGVDMKTSVGDIEHPIWTVTFRAGTYKFNCDVHAAMKGTFAVAAGAPPPPSRCRVPKVIGKTLGPARRAIRQRHCSVGRVRYTRSARARNKVLSQSPRAGRRLARGTRINLVVSRGPG